MARPSNTGAGSDLERYMGLLSDVRRAAILICDSIRVREEAATRRSPAVPRPVAENAPRCPICMLEYKHPTVVLSICGHVGIMPSTVDAAEWRTVQLTALWKEGEVSNSGVRSNAEFQDLVRRLYLLIQTLFRNSNDFSSAMGDVLRRFGQALNFQEEVRRSAEGETRRLQDMGGSITTELYEKKLDLLRREKRVLRSEHQHARFITRCVNAMTREHWKDMRSLGTVTRIQSKLERAVDEIGQAVRNLDSTRRDIGAVNRLHSELVVSATQNVGASRVQRAPSENVPGNQRTPAHCEESAPNFEESEVIRIEDSPDSNENDTGGNGNRETGARQRSSVQNAASRRRVMKRPRGNYRIE